MLHMASSTEYKLTVKNDNLAVDEVSRPHALFDQNKTGGLCVSENPYKFALRKMSASFNKEGQCGFILDQKFFNIALKDIKFSRAVYLPGCKVFYAVKSIEPYETYVLDLHNLDINMSTTFINERIPNVGVVNTP